MKYYPKIIFRLLVLIDVLVLLFTFFYAFLTYMISGLGLAHPSNYDEMVLNSILQYCVPMFGFLSLSLIILFLQQYKNYRFGYFSVAIIISEVWILKINYPLFDLFKYLLSEFLNYSTAETLWPVAFWLIVGVIMLAVTVIPFYVLVKLIKEDFFKKPKIVK